MYAPWKVSDFMTKKTITFTPEMNALAAIDILLNNKISGAPVIDTDNQVIGVLSEKDCLRLVLEASYHNDPGKLVRELMSTSITAVDPHMSIVDVAEKFINTQFRRFPVVEKGKLVGQISRRDVLQAIKKIRNS